MKAIKIVTVASLIALSVPALASLHWDQVYIGGEVGIADLGTPNSNLISQDAISRNPSVAPTDQSYDTTDFAWGVRGGVRPLQKGAFDFGLELAYQNFGTAEYDVTNVETDPDAENGYRDVEIEAVSGFLTGQYNHGIIFAFLKIGAAYTLTEINQQDVINMRSPSQSDINNITQNYHDILPAINFGAGIHITDYVELFVAYQQLFGNGNGNADYTEEGPLELPSNANDINMISIGLNVGNFADR